MTKRTKTPTDKGERKKDQPSPPNPVRVGFQGAEQAYGYLAARKHFKARGEPAQLVACPRFEDTVEAVEAGNADFAVLPIENTTAGSINRVYDLLRETDVSIVGEETWRVDHCLAASASVPLEQLSRVLSHPQALEQCSTFLSGLGECELVTFINTAEAMRAVANAGNPAQAAIGSPEAAKAYGLAILETSIANQEENYTRFVVLARKPVTYDSTVPCKTSIIFALRHEPGALLECIGVLARHQLNLTKLESRPRPHHPWEYHFYLDFQGNVSSPDVAKALVELRENTLSLKFLGSYPVRALAER